MKKPTLRRPRAAHTSALLAAEDLPRIMAGARAMIWHAIVREVKGGYDWRIRLSNEEAGARLWPVARAPGQSYTDAWYLARVPEDNARLDRTFVEALREGRTHYAQEFRIRLADGQIRWLSEDVQVESLNARRWRLVGVYTDVTERKQEQDALRNVMTHAHCLIWHATYEKVEDEWTWSMQIINEQAARAWLPIPQAPGQTITEAWGLATLPEDRPVMDARTIQAREVELSRYQQEYRVRLADGRICWLSEDVQIERVNVDHWRYVGVCTDITERKTAESILAVRNARNRRIAETWQRSMLREIPPDAFPGLELRTFYEAALEEFKVGGDFFDAYALDESRVALVVGDVSGKGLAAAARTAEVKYALRAFLHAYADPGEALAQLNDLLSRGEAPHGSEEATLVVLALAVVNKGTGEALFAGAGTEPSLVLRAVGDVETIETVGRVLGVGPGTTYAVRRLKMEAADTILMATDGLTEARHGLSFLGTEGLAALAQEAGASASLTEIGQAILRGARSFTGGPLRDDVCLLLARRF